MLVHVEVGFLLLERAYAKINLTLDVLSRRSDGYHEVDMVMQSIDLSDLIWLDRLQSGRIVIESNAAHIPTDDRNLAVQAARAFVKYTGIKSGIHITLEKNIPVAAGLAGGSSDAAAVLRGLNRMFRTALTEEQLSKLAEGIGSDVPFCIRGGTAIARGRGETLETIPHNTEMYVLLIHPRIFVSTGEIYQALKMADFSRHTTSGRMKQALLSNEVDDIPDIVHNGLQPVTYRLYPEVAQLAERVELITHHPVYMSGSGPTLFCLAPTVQLAHRMYNALKGVMLDVHLSHFVNH